MLSAPNQLTDALAALPWGVHLVVAATLLGGLILWAAGRQVLKPVVALSTCALAALAGFLLLPVIVPTANLSPYWGGLGGLLVGLLAGLLLYRLALAATFGLTLAAAGGILAAAIISAPGLRPAAATAWTAPGDGGLGGDEQPAPATGERTRNPYPDVVNPAGPPPAAAPARSAPTPQPDGTAPPPAAAGARPLIGLPSLESTTDVSARAREAWAAARERAAAAWGRFRATDQMVISLAALIGLFAGGVIGLTLPAWAAGVVTALAGAAIWLPCAAWLATTTRAPGHERLDLTPSGWAVVWGVVALVGVAVQWTGLMSGIAKESRPGRARRASRPAAA